MRSKEIFGFEMTMAFERTVDNVAKSPPQSVVLAETWLFCYLSDTLVLMLDIASFPTFKAECIYDPLAEVKAAVIAPGKATISAIAEI